MHAKRTEDLTRPGARSRPVARLVPFLLLALSALLPAPAFADDVDRVRELRNSDSIMPLSRILDALQKPYPGTLLEVELEEERGLVIYEIELLGKDHTVHHLKVDAKTGHVISEDKGH